MAEENTDEKTEESQAQAGEQSEDGEDGRPKEAKSGEQRAEEDDTISTDKQCPECGEPIHNLRAACPKCGYEYQKDDYDDTEAGSEFRTGSEIDDSEKGKKGKAEGEPAAKAEAGSRSSDQSDKDEG
jgi:ribosomal protein S27AE